VCVEEEFAALKDIAAPGLSVSVDFETPARGAPNVLGGAHPKIAVLREQGVNGHVEMAVAFERAGFTAIDVHMSDLQKGRVRLKDFDGLVSCGGFSYGDVLGAGQGWAKSILFNDVLRDEFSNFFIRPNSFALGVCNGCQMMANLAQIIPGAQDWPSFERNRSEQFEARLVMVELPQSPSLFFKGMGGSRLPVVVSHGEGKAVFASQASAQSAIVAMRYIDTRGSTATKYPANPNGSPDGIGGLTTADGRFTILMPHPERVLRSVQMSWHPREWGDDSPWLKMFANARAGLG
jgi:phosphoribosylformylglycinamidine synthase